MTDTSTILSEVTFPRLVRRLREEAAGRDKADEVLRELAFVLHLTQRVKDEIVAEKR
jgi:hypothetical protein